MFPKRASHLRAALACSVTILSGHCVAESWVEYFERKGDITKYIDADSVRRVPNHPAFLDFRIKHETPKHPDLPFDLPIHYYQYVANCDDQKVGSYRTDSFDRAGRRTGINIKYRSSEAAVQAIERGELKTWYFMEANDVCQGVWRLEEAHKIPPIELTKIAEAQDKKKTAARSQSAKSTSSTIKIPLRKRGGVYEVMATLNAEIKVYFIVDSGAADVTINEKIAQLLVDNGSITKADLIGSRTYQVADGKTASGVAIKIRALNIGGRVLKDVNAVVLKGDGVPVLLGQSALGRLGKWSINVEVPQLEITP